ncbi:hypothetical protein MRS44_009443 [Fusarium solani]|uniref:Uncharacterized protein n=1 Tax=Fusarium solani TaxID=169388 RepID=A0A9P9JRI1_FUSSL|nr:uncharacterized protein B0J15DRAFT_471343 [Fusarium solani]KAH7235107.1 hypothetical protein B0J15DRAFT_471343 [Fusarium solani]KAJ3464657.1 hypothetical protein MRS44_009443 [Fusarium solani]
MSECSYRIKSENRGEGSSEKPMKPNDLDDHTHLGESSSGEVKQDHGEEGNEQNNQVDGTAFEQDDTSQCDELLGNDECTTQAEFPASEDSVEDAFIQELEACLDQSGFKWVYLSTTMITNTLVVGFLQYPANKNKAEDLKRELRMAMKGRELPIKFVDVTASWKCD